MRGNRTNHKVTPPEVRFWKHVSKSDAPDGCWEWNGGATRRGYGAFSLTHDKQIPAHRYAYELTYGPIHHGQLVCHTCDNRSCCRPDHLFVGTYQDNSDDKVAKGRHPHGETHGYAKLTWDQVRMIRARYTNGEKQTALERELGIDQTTISLIVRNKTWKDRNSESLTGRELAARK